MKLATAKTLAAIPHGAVIYGGFTQPFGADVPYIDAWRRIAAIVDGNAPRDFILAEEEKGVDVSGDLAEAVLHGILWPNDGCKVTFFLYSTEE